MAGLSAKNLLTPGSEGGFTNGLGENLSQQLQDEEDQRANQLKLARNASTAMGGGQAMGMSSIGLLGAGGSLGR
jgi:hypothetical protein